MAFLEKGKWAIHYDSCVQCLKTKHKHKGHGLCTACWCKTRGNTNLYIILYMLYWVCY